ncbi:MAG: MBL fold metallo-hydrolase [Christensenellales bacterium]
MNIHIAGGVGEHGRNCFYIEGSGGAFLVDCGLTTGTQMPNPRLSPEQIARADCLFITHSHLDHVGAYPWLVSQGFHGQVVASSETLLQLAFPVERGQGLQPGHTLRLGDNLRADCGRSGHCVGSLWFDISFEDKQLIFSGDYAEDTLIYRCDKLRGKRADLAFLDNSLDSSKGSPETMRLRVLDLVRETVGRSRPVILPVPKYGRGLELMHLLHNVAYFNLDDGSRRALEMTTLNKEWFKGPMPDLSGVGGSIYFVSDSQLKHPGNRVMAERLMSQEEALIVVTGHMDPGSFSEKLMNRGRVEHLPYPGHASDHTVDLLASLNDFAHIVRTHSERYDHPRDFVL